MKEGFAGEGRKKITSLFSSERRYQRSGSITTATVDKEDPLRQSRILNLPNYKKDTLDGRLDFVVVFQTIEIERLSVEIESLRVRLADRERQIFNYKNYEVQIRELTQRCYQYEAEKINYEQQLAMLNQSLRQVQSDVQDFKQKCYSLEDALREQQEMAFSLKENLIIERKHREQLQEGRLMLESSIKQKEKLYSRQLRDMEKSTQFKRNELTKNEEHLGNLLKKYHQEVSSLQKENLNLRNLYDTIEHQSQDLERRYEDLQGDLYRCNQALKEKEFELETVEQENRERVELLQLRYEEQYNSKCRRVDECEQQLNEWKGEVDKLQQQNESLQLKIGQNCEQIERYETLLNEAGDEIDRLNTIIKDKIKYLDAWQVRYNQLQDKHNHAEESLNIHKQSQVTQKEEIMRLTHALKYKSEQIEKYERTRELEERTISQKLKEIETTRQEIAAIKREKEIEREDQRRKHLQNVQLKEQLNKRIVEGNKLFEDLNKAEIEIKKLKQNISHQETALRIKEDELSQVKEKLVTTQGRLEKLYADKRSIEQEAMRIKALQQRIRHEEAKKNEYYAEGKRLSLKLKECEKQLTDSRRHGAQLEADLDKFQKYTEKLITRVTDLEQRLQLLEQLRREIASLNQKNNALENDLAVLTQTISKKIAQIAALKEKVHTFEKYIKQFMVRQATFKQQLQTYERLESDLKHLKEKYQNLEDVRDQLDTDLATAMAQIDHLVKENGSLQRVIAINTQEMQRTEQSLGEAKLQIQANKERQKELTSRIKETERKIKSSLHDVEKQKDRVFKEKIQLQKLLERKSNELEDEIKRHRTQRQSLAQRNDKQVKALEAEKAELSEENSSFRVLLKKYEEEKERQAKTCKELEKKIISYEHELQRIVQNGSEAKKELQISNKKIEKMEGKVRQAEEKLKQQLQRIGELLTEKEHLLSSIADRERIIASKQSDNSHLLRQNQLFQKEMKSLRDELTVQQQRDLQLCEELIKIKFESESVTQQYNGFKIRMANMQNLMQQLKQKLLQTIKHSSKLEDDKARLEKNYSAYQQRLVAEIGRMEQEQYKQAEEIIRLDTLNRILQIEIGEYKERQSAVFSIVKQTSMLKERKEFSPLKENAQQEAKLKSDRELKEMQNVTRKSRIASTSVSQTVEKSHLKESQQLLRQSMLFGQFPTQRQIDRLHSRSKGKVKPEEELVEISYCEKGDNTLLKSSKKCLYFEDLVFKPI